MFFGPLHIALVVVTGYAIKLVHTSCFSPSHKIITTINIRFVHLTLMISLCLSSIVNAMYLVALDTVITTLLINYDQVTFDTINDISDGIIIKCVRISSIGLSFSFLCLQIVYRVKYLY